MGNPKPPTTPVSSTPTRIGGKERRAKVKLWRNLAESSARINLLRVLIKDGIGFNEIEEFEIGLQSKFKSTKFKNIAANTRQEGVNGIQDSYSNPLMINRGHPSNETYLGGTEPSVESPPAGATGDHLSFPLGFDPEMLQWYDQNGHPSDENGNPVQNVTEPVIVNQNDTRQNDASMQDLHADQPDYPQLENPQSESMQPEDQTGHGDANGYDI